MERLTVTISGMTPETRARLVILRATLHKTWPRLLDDMTEMYWKLHKDDAAAYCSPNTLEDTIAFALKITEQRFPYEITKKRRAKRLYVRETFRGQNNTPNRRDRVVRNALRRDVPPVPVPKNDSDIQQG